MSNPEIAPMLAKAGLRMQRPHEMPTIQSAHISHENIR
jgi:hypothetical protein